MGYLIPILLMFMACKQEHVIHISTRTANRVKIGTPILYKGVQVGNVKNYSFPNSRVLLGVEIDKTALPLTSHCQFHLENINSFDVGIILTKEDSITNKLNTKRNTIYCNLEFPKVESKTPDSISREATIKMIHFFLTKIDRIVRKTKQMK